MKIKPLFDRVLILPTPEKTTSGGLTLPSTTTEKPFFGKVIAIGNGCNTEGKKSAMEVAVGDKVLYSKYGGTAIMIDKTEYVIMRQADILAICEEK
jgi:chaperonin GroES